MYFKTYDVYSNFMYAIFFSFHFFRIGMGVLISSVIGTEHNHVMAAFVTCASTSLFAMRWSLKDVTLCTLNSDRLQYVYAQYTVQASPSTVALPGDLCKHEIMLGAPDLAVLVKRRLEKTKIQWNEDSEELFTGGRPMNLNTGTLNPLVVGADFSDVFHEPHYDIEVFYPSI